MLVSWNIYWLVYFYIDLRCYYNKKYINHLKPYVLSSPEENGEKGWWFWFDVCEKLILLLPKEGVKGATGLRKEVLAIFVGLNLKVLGDSLDET